MLALYSNSSYVQTCYFKRTQLTNLATIQVNNTMTAAAVYIIRPSGPSEFSPEMANTRARPSPPTQTTTKEARLATSRNCSKWPISRAFRGRSYNTRRAGQDALVSISCLFSHAWTIFWPPKLGAKMNSNCAPFAKNHGPSFPIQLWHIITLVILGPNDLGPWASGE